MSFELWATIGAAWATAWNLWAWHWAPMPWRRLYMVTAGFSAMYVVAWGWLVVSPGTDRGNWSEVVTPISLTSFFAVWASFPILSSIRNRRTRSAVAKVVSDA